MKNIHQKSIWHDQTCGLIIIYLLHMHVAFMMFYRMNITKSYRLSYTTLETGGIMEGKAAISYIVLKCLLNYFYDWLNHFAYIDEGDLRFTNDSYSNVFEFDSWLIRNLRPRQNNKKIGQYWTKVIYFGPDFFFS